MSTKVLKHGETKAARQVIIGKQLVREYLTAGEPENPRKKLSGRPGNPIFKKKPKNMVFFTKFQNVKKAFCG